MSLDFFITILIFE